MVKKGKKKKERESYVLSNLFVDSSAIGLFVYLFACFFNKKKL